MMTGVMIHSESNSDPFETSVASVNTETPGSRVDSFTGTQKLTEKFEYGEVFDNSFGRTKAPPTCVAAELKSHSMTCSQILQFVFPVKGSEMHPCQRTAYSKDSNGLTSKLIPIMSDAFTEDAETHRIPASVSVIASSPSCCASTTSSNRDSDGLALSDSESKFVNTTQCKTLSDSKKLTTSILRRTESRQGRASQRWVTGSDSSINEPIRLVTGTVPILKGGKILFISASRKPEWILPKGGWEGDESMEESAIRESFEEAGVVGVLGERLSPIQYETRKSKKRRIDMEELKICHLNNTVQRPIDSPPSAAEPLPNDHLPNLSKAASTAQNIEPLVTNRLLPVDETTDAGSGQITKNTDETMSVGSTYSSNYSQVKMILFPLYITDVLDKWPESGRLRTAVSIDEAIDMMDCRPEFKSILIEVKALGLHLLADPEN